MRGTREQREFLDDRVFSMPERWLFLHLVYSFRHENGLYSVSDREGQHYYPIPCRFIEHTLGGPRCTREVWEGALLIDVWRSGWYSPERNLCREMRVEPKALERWQDLGEEGERRYWLHTPEPRRTAQSTPETTRVRDENGRRYPKLIDQALRVLKGADHAFRMEAVERAVEALSDPKTEEERARLCSLRSLLEVIRRQWDPESETTRNAYEVQLLSGRIQFKGGGPQGLPRAVKFRAYDFERVYNYDIGSCHSEALRHLAEDLQKVGVMVDTEPLDRYLEKGGKEVVARKTGLPRSLVKATEHAVKYGACLPANLDHARAIGRKIGHVPEIARIADKEVESSDQALKKLREVFWNIRQMVSRMSRALVGEYFETHKQPGGPQGYCMKNACGIAFRPKGFSEGHERETKAMAWYLQGLEAAYVHWVTVLSQEYGYKPIANEHDGLITKGRVPKEAKEEARRRSGFARAELVEKPLATNEEVEEIYGRMVEENTVSKDLLRGIGGVSGLSILETSADYVAQICGTSDKYGYDRIFACEVGEERYVVAAGPDSLIEFGSKGEKESNEYYKVEDYTHETTPLTARQAYRRARRLDGTGCSPTDKLRRRQAETLDLPPRKVETIKAQIGATSAQG
jgi:hypothetical protein